MNKIFDITAFGAVGDGVTDCTAAIQAAMDAAAEAGGGVVEVPPGVYATGMVHLHGERMTVHGYGGFGYHSDGNSVFKLNDPSAECLLDITGAYGCLVEGIGLDGGKLGKNIHGIRLDWEKHYRPSRSREDTPTITGCRSARFTGDGISLNNVWAFKVNHSMLLFNGGAGLFYMGCDAFVSDCIMNGNARGGVDGTSTWASGATFTANRIEWNGMGGIRLGRSTSLNITGNYLDRNYGPAIDLGGEEDVVFNDVAITGNVLVRNGAIRDDWDMARRDPDLCCHVRLRQCHNLVMSANTMKTGRNDYGDGEDTPNCAVLLQDCGYCIIKDNVMDRGYIKKDFDLRGDCSTCIIKDNIGRPM